MNNRAISLPDLASEKKTGLQQVSMGCHASCTSQELGLAFC